MGGVPPSGIFRHPAGGVVGSRPDRRVTFLRGQESNQRNRRGPLPAPWTPGAAVPDLRPLLAFKLEPSSGLSAAWVDTRRPPPFGCCAAEGMGFGVGSPTEGGSGRIEPLRRCAPPPLSKGRLRGVGVGPSVSAHQPPPSEGEVASKLPPASLPPWGEGRERGPPYFPPQGILIPSSLMLLTGFLRRAAAGG